MDSKRSSSLIAINVYWFAISYLWNGLGPIILPLLVAGLVPEGVKGSALGLLTAVGMATAIVVQPLAGALSDRSTSRFGRRRPYMLGGTLADLVFLLGIALAPGYGALLLAYLGLQVASNVAHGPYQALIPDQVPPQRWGQASGVKQLAEIVGIIVTSQAIGYLMARGQTLPAMASIALCLLVAIAVTLWRVREEPLRRVSTQRLLPLPHVTLWRVREEPLRQAPADPLLRAVLTTFSIDLRRYAGFAWLLVSRLLIVLAMNLVRNYVLYYIQFILQVSAEEAAGATGTLLAILAVAIALIVYPAGALSDRLGRKPLVVFSGLLGAVGSLLLLLVRSYAHLLVFGGVLGLSIGVFLSANWAMLTDLAPADEAGRYLGLSNLATAGAALLAGLGGPLLDVLNAQAPGRGYVALYVLACVCYLVGTAVLVQVREVRRAAALGA